MKKIKTISLMGVLASALTLVNPVTHAAVIFDNGTFGAVTGVSDLDHVRIAADDFMLSSAATVQSIGWRGRMLVQPSQGGTYDQPDDFTIRIHSDSSGPGAVLHTFSVGNSATRTSTGLFAGGQETFDYSVNIAPTLLAGGTTFWISIFNNTVADTDDDWSWGRGSTGVSGSPGDTFTSSNGGTTWGGETGSYSFYLDDAAVAPVPVPAAVWLMGSALMGLFGFSKRKKA